MHFIVVTYRNMGKELVAYRNINNSKIAVATKPTPGWVTAYQSWEPGTPFTACKQLNRPESVFPRCSVDLKLFQAAALVLESSLCFPSLSLPCSCFLRSPAGRA